MISELKDKRYLVEYLRNDKKQIYGVMLAYKNEANEVCYGWSKVGVSKTGKFKDNFVKDRGLLIAFMRAKNLGLKKLPTDFRGKVENFTKNCEEYFTPRPVLPPKHKNEISYKEML